MKLLARTFARFLVKLRTVQEPQSIIAGAVSAGFTKVSPVLRTAPGT